MNNNKILIVRLSSLGDVLLTSPLLKLLKKKYPKSVIDFLVKERFAQAIEYHPNISQLLKLNENNVSFIKKLIYTQRYDVIIDLQNNLRSRLLIMNSGAKVYRFKKPTFKKFLLVKFKINLLKPYKSIAQRYLESVPELQFVQDDLQLNFYYPDEWNEKARTILPADYEKERTIGICPGSKHFTKRYPAEHLQSLISMLIDLGYSIFLFGGKDDKEICHNLSLISNQVSNYQNDDNLFLTSAMMRNCSLIISNDSAMMHLASALNVPIIATFGSTVKDFGFAPLNENSLIIENNQINCRPCSHIGRKDCPKKHFKCMNEIQPAMIVEGVKKINSL